MFSMVERVLGLVAEVVCLKMLEELALYMHGGWIGRRVGEHHVHDQLPLYVANTFVVVLVYHVVVCDV